MMSVLLLSVISSIAGSALALYVRLIKNNRLIKKRNKIKIAYLRTDFSFGIKAGGSLSHIAGFCKGTKENNNEIILITTDQITNIDPKLVPVYIVKPPEKWKKYPLTMQILAYNWIFFKECISIFKKEKPDCICQRHSVLNFSGVLLSIMLKIPFVLEYNSSSYWRQSKSEKIKFKPILKLIEDLNLNRADRITVVSSILKNQLIKRNYKENKVVVNPNGADCKLFNPDICNERIRLKYNLENNIVVGFTGVYGVWHGVENLVEAAKELTEINKKIVLFFIGDDKLVEIVTKIAEKNGILNKIRFEKYVKHEEMPYYLAACDILVSPHVNMADNSDFFGSPVKLFEYMAMGKPIVASKIGQIADILENENNALLVTPGSREELVKSIKMLVEKPQLRNRIGEKARVKCKSNFTWKHNAQRVIDGLFN